MARDTISMVFEPNTRPCPVSTLRRSMPQVLAVMIKNLLIFTQGLSAGHVMLLIPQLSDQSVGENLFLNKDRASWIVSITFLCVSVGCIFSGVAVSVLGSRRMMQITCIPSTLCFIGFYFVDNVWQIYLILAIMGVAGGICEAPIMIYTAEIAEPKLRGMLSATGSFCFLLGVLVEITLGTFLNWRTCALINCSVPFAAFFFFFFAPESPYWLISKNRTEEAKNYLAWLRGWVEFEDVEEEYEELLAIYKIKSMERSRFSPKEFLNKSFIVPLGLVTFLLSLVIFSGSLEMQTFSIKIFQALQVPLDPYYSTIILTSALLLGTLPCIILIHYVGKRVLMFSSLIVGGLCLMVVASYAFIINAKQLDFPEFAKLNLAAEEFKWVSLIFLVLYAFAIQSGVRTVPYILIGELFPRRTNKVGSSASGVVYSLLMAFGNKVFLHIVEALTLPGTLWLCGAICFVSVVVLYFWLPETEGKTIEEIADHFAGVAKLDNKVRRRHIRETESML